MAPGASSASSPTWHTDAATVAASLGVDVAHGLPAADVARRLRAHGANRLQARAPRPWWRVAASQFASLITALLAVGAAAAVVAGEFVEAAAIGAVLALNGVIGFVMEWRATRAMDALRALGGARATVRRDGAVTRVSAETLVPGDVVVLEGGDVVTADLRLVEASRLAADESTLTGESVPVEKGAASVPAAAPLAERRSMLFKGSAVVRGSGEGVVVATGDDTELGRIGALVAETPDEETPLERRLAALGRRLAWLAVAVAVLLAIAGLARGGDALLVVETAIALAVAAVPEGLPIIATIALARGMRRMASRNALVNRLAAVETLGSTTVVLADKTGTLTANRLVAERVESADGAERRLLEAAALCNDAEPADGGWLGDPVDVALADLADRRDVSPSSLRARWPRVHEEAFDPELRIMGTVHRADGRSRTAVKGAFEAVLARATRVAGAHGDRPLDDATRAQWADRHDALADAGWRVLAVADREGGPDDDPYADLCLLGLVGIADPPREGVAEAIAACRAAGVRVIMATGDHPGTARAIAARIGLADEAPLTGATLAEGVTADAMRRASILARLTPAQKLEVLEAHRAAGEVVAMTGDGVNDAPALARADVGVAMGERGTEVARQAADIVLRDDHPATIVAAIREGRVIVRNLRAFARYLLSCNASEVAVIGIATIVGGPLPLLPLQILYLNLVTDVFPALALGLGEGEADVMRRPPRDPRAPLLTRRDWRGIAGGAALLTGGVLLARALAVGRGAPATDTTVPFLTLAFAQLWHVFAMRARGAALLRNAVTRNGWVWGALGLCVPLVVATVAWPALARVLGMRAPTTTEWLVVLACSVLPLALGEVVRAVCARRDAASGAGA